MAKILDHELEISENFTMEDIRKIRDYMSDKYTNDDGSFDNDGWLAEVTEAANRVKVELARLRAEKGNIIANA